MTSWMKSPDWEGGIISQTSYEKMKLEQLCCLSRLPILSQGHNFWAHWLLEQIQWRYSIPKDMELFPLLWRRSVGGEERRGSAGAQRLLRAALQPLTAGTALGSAARREQDEVGGHGDGQEGVGRLQGVPAIGDWGCGRCAGTRRLLGL